ncbi:MAG: hypothetical protein KQI78_12195 [Deltaproteobacteria bacterium]|nr:hypothetical protein [Deltaproteobacteria bacterium]
MTIKRRKESSQQQKMPASDTRFDELMDRYENVEFDLVRAQNGAEYARKLIRELQNYKSNFPNTVTQEMTDCLKRRVNVEIMLAKVIKFRNTTDIVRRLEEAHNALSQEISQLTDKLNKARQTIEDYQDQ